MLCWPADLERPDPGTLWRWLESACARDLLTRTGTGRRGDAFRYGLPGLDTGPS